MGNDRTTHRSTGDRCRTPRPVSGWASLTETELRVAVLVSEGRTNADAAACLFLSRHTVDFHLRQIFRKLMIHSRVELVRLAMENGALGSIRRPADAPLGRRS